MEIKWMFIFFVLFCVGVKKLGLLEDEAAAVHIIYHNQASLSPSTNLGADKFANYCASQ